ncbi:MAG: SIMPL domain-containing protein [Cyanobacteria bacterium P01_F01_bin.143]
MKPHIEVVGESKYLETIQKYVAYINLIVWTNRKKIALDELVDLRVRCIETLKSNGLKHSELKEGGISVERKWLNSRKNRQEANQKIIISCEDIYSLVQALSQLEPLFKHRRYSFTLEMLQPIFTKNSGVEKKAKKEAIQNALIHATLLAEGANLELDGIIEIEELTPIIGAEGIYNDELDSMLISSSNSNNNLNSKILENPSREITVRCRVNFSTKGSSMNTSPLNSVDFD